MLSLPPTLRVFVAADPFDMRGSFDAIAGAVRRLEFDPVNGHVYLFLNRLGGAAATRDLDEGIDEIEARARAAAR